MELSPVQPLPKIQRVDGRLFVDVAIGRCEIRPSHNDRTKARWWTVIGPNGKAVSPAVGAVRIAAAWAASIAA